MKNEFSTGQRIKEIRMEQGLSQEQLALRAEITTTYLGQVERNQKNPTIKMVEQICDALNISLADFFSSSSNTPDLVDSLSSQILIQISDRSDDEKYMLLQVIKNLLKFRDLPDNQT